MELVAGLPERPGSQQRHFLQAPKDVFVCSVLIYVQRIRGFTTMRYRNLHFTYLHSCLTLVAGLVLSAGVIHSPFCVGHVYQPVLSHANCYMVNLAHCMPRSLFHCTIVSFACVFQHQQHSLPSVSRHVERLSLFIQFSYSTSLFPGLSCPTHSSLIVEYVQTVLNTLRF